MGAPLAGAKSLAVGNPAGAPACTSTNPINLGDPATTGSISVAGQADCYTFDGVVGDRVHITVAVTDGTLVA